MSFYKETLRRLLEDRTLVSPRLNTIGEARKRSPATLIPSIIIRYILFTPSPTSVTERKTALS